MIKTVAIDMKLGLKDTINVLECELSSLLDKKDIQFIDNGRNGFEYEPMKNIQSENIKIVVHRVNNNLTRIKVTNRLDLDVVNSMLDNIVKEIEIISVTSGQVTVSMEDIGNKVINSVSLSSDIKDKSGDIVKRLGDWTWT